MACEFKPETAIKIAADDVQSLRRCDVFRVLDWATAENRPALAGYILAHRGDLSGEVGEVLAELADG